MADSSVIIAIGVLSLFRPDTLVLRSDVAIQCGTEGFQPGQAVVISKAMTCTTPALWTIEVPGRISRQYRGVLSVIQSGNSLTPVIRMNIENAVAAVVAAELPATAPFEAQKAMAVLARSYYSASRKRHSLYDFCDTTHCQYHRETPTETEGPANAARLTKGLVSFYRGRPFAALYSASCGGHTLTSHADDYAYRSVPCAACRSDASWSRTLPKDVASRLLDRQSESERLKVVREHGWSSVPSNNYRAVERNGSIHLEGRGAGHGMGVCQRGAIAMAAEGATFREILRHYLPDSTVE